MSNIIDFQTIKRKKPSPALIEMWEFWSKKYNIPMAGFYRNYDRLSTETISDSAKNVHGRIRRYD